MLRGVRRQLCREAAGGRLRRVAGLPGAVMPQAEGEAGAGTILSLIPHRCVQGLRCLLLILFVLHPEPENRLVDFSAHFQLRASGLTFLFVIQNNPRCPPGELLLEIPFGQTSCYSFTFTEGLLTLREGP